MEEPTTLELFPVTNVTAGKTDCNAHGVAQSVVNSTIVEEPAALVESSETSVHISEGHFRGTDFWVEMKKWPANLTQCCHEKIAKTEALATKKCNGSSGK